MNRRGTLILAVLLLGLGLPATAHADKGVAVDLGKVEVSKDLSPGGSYSLPIIGVRNPGTEASTYRMGVSHLEGQSEFTPDEDWFDFSPREFSLQPGERQPVKVKLDIPTGARPGDYVGLLKAEIVSEGEGPQVGAAAAAKLSFTVKPSTILQAWLLRAQTFIEDGAPWSYVIPPSVLLVVVLAWFSRRFRLGLRLERRG